MSAEGDDGIELEEMEKGSTEKLPRLQGLDALLPPKKDHVETSSELENKAKHKTAAKDIAEGFGSKLQTKEKAKLTKDEILQKATSRLGKLGKFEGPEKESQDDDDQGDKIKADKQSSNRTFTGVGLSKIVISVLTRLSIQLQSAS